MENKGFSEIILVKNPNTGKHINIQPLFKMSFEMTEKGEANVKQIKKKVDDAIRLLSTHHFEERDTDDYAKQLTSDLYQISDMFEEMENY